MRSRYIAFSINSESNTIFNRKQVIHTLQQECLHQFQTSCNTYDFFLTRFQKNTGILRCFHTEKNRAISFLQSIKKIDDISVDIETIATSGTIKALIKKHLSEIFTKEKS